ncbi:hypothetical protein [Streptomyces sp. NPDC048361]|uniref:hypothetical protein n=1 Tax=Streptomyces sp. NPDC048361 TaxID=3154720 RepID=UPI003417FE84
MLLLRTVVASRPMHEVAALVHLLNEAGGYPPPGDQALRLAAVTRSVNEVHQLISVLQEPPGTAEDAGTALHAAAMERPIEDVAALIASFGSGDDELRVRVSEAAERRAQEAAETGPPVRSAAAAAAPAQAAEAAGTPVRAEALMRADALMPAAGGGEHPGPDAHSALTAEEQAAMALSAPDATFGGQPDATFGGQEPMAPFAPEAPADAPAAQTRTAPEAMAPPRPQAAPAQAPAAPEKAAATTSKRSSATLPVRSVLRWPAAVALLVIGAIHLPTDLRDLRSGDLAAGASLGIAAVCLTLALLLPLYDPLWAWMAGAAAALGIVVVHSLATGLNSVHLLRDSLGSTFTGATRLMVLCAVIAAALAATVLTRKPKVSPANEA